MSTTNVKFFTVSAANEVERSHICFSTLQYVSPFPKKVRYVCPIKCSTKAVEIWLCCLSVWIDQRYSFKFSKDLKEVEFVLNTEGLGYRKALTYLTFFRYFDEAAKFLDAFTEDAKDDISTQSLFTKMLAHHMKGSGLPIDCHTLIDKYYLKPNPKMTVEDFKKRLADMSIDNVQEHFKA